FPTDRTDSLTINVVGAANVEDSLAEGYDFQLAAARKPGLTQTLTTPAGAVLAFGDVWDSTKAKDPTADNFAALAQVRKDATNATQLHFDVETEAIPGPPIAYGDS